jgi:hypothetical protein
MEAFSKIRQSIHVELKKRNEAKNRYSTYTILGLVCMTVPQPKRYSEGRQTATDPLPNRYRSATASWVPRTKLWRLEKVIFISN